jgi:hypothetical protein
VSDGSESGLARCHLQLRIAICAAAVASALVVRATVGTLDGPIVERLACFSFLLLPLGLAVLATVIAVHPRRLQSRFGSIKGWSAIGFAVGCIASTIFLYATFSPPRGGTPGFSTAAIAFVVFPILGLVAGISAAAVAFAAALLTSVLQRSSAEPIAPADVHARS